MVWGARMVENLPPMEEDPLLSDSDALSELFEHNHDYDSSTSDDDDDQITLKTRICSVTDKLTFGHLRWLLIRLTLIFVLVSAVFSTSVLIYLAFYQMYVPVVNQKIPVYFQFDSDKPPAALVETSNLAFMRSGIAYDFILDIDLPDIPGLSLTVGNYMTSMEAYIKEKADPWLKVSRPALIPYRSGVARFVSSTLKMMPVLFGWCDERISHRSFLAKAIKSPAEGLSSVKIALSSSKIPIYEARLLITAHFTGLRYWMYHWKVTCAVATIFILFMAQLLSTTTLLLIYYVVKKRSESMLQASIPRESGPKRSLSFKRGRSRSRSSIKYRPISGSMDGIRKRRPFSVERTSLHREA